jgi:hypothetical protein
MLFPQTSNKNFSSSMTAATQAHSAPPCCAAVTAAAAAAIAAVAAAEMFSFSSVPTFVSPEPPGSNCRCYTFRLAMVPAQCRQ